MNVERFVIEASRERLENSVPKNSDPLDVSKTQTRKTQTLLLSRKLRADEYNKSVFASGCFLLMLSFCL